ncbi:ABC-type multidrug transport system, ATPase and permease component [Gynuella sunshinyii YC6258]|uniref:ABC-type multidrug transport system, ATPase and permease component n=2 Tax=Gynuella sunshinyii TaxID=1445505 RepID=A0A0C5VMI4_9GAMM|nr:ABC-type multidrug transport system, ATPase and permease component [Gynuella sunshinyii YC6258]
MVLALVTAATEASFTLVTKYVVDEISMHGSQANLLPYAVAFAVLTLIFVFCIRTFIVLAGTLSNQLMYELRRRTFEHLQQLSFSFFDQNAVGWLVARVTSDCARIARLIAWGTLDLFWSVPFIIGIFGVLFILNYRLAFILLTVLPVLAVVSVFFSFRILKSSRLVRKTNSRLTAVYNEGIAGVQTSRVLVREQENLEEFKEDSTLMKRLSTNNLLLSAAYYPLVTLLISVATGFAIWFGGESVLVGVITVGTLVAFISYSRTLSDPLLQLAQMLTDLQRTTACAERVLGLLAVKPQIYDSETVLQKMAACQGAETPDGGDSEIRDIRFQNVVFSYKTSEPVLKQFNFNTLAGKSIALVGPTGSGKSTIVNLMCRFYEPVSGQILINGVDYRERSLAWLQSNLGIVMQTPFLFSGTIRSNIRYGKLDATDTEIEEAAKLVNAHDLIMALEHGYDTEVGEGGNNLSTGQKQLISFARAVIGDPQILIMDEATSSVDTQTEYVLQQGLKAVLKNRTSFIIAHRLSTIREADCILYIENGELLEQGNHAELLAQRGRYFELYEKQYRKELEDELMVHDV